MSGGTYGLMSTPNDRFFEKLLFSFFFFLPQFSLNLFKASLSKKLKEKILKRLPKC